MTEAFSLPFFQTAVIASLVLAGGAGIATAL